MEQTHDLLNYVDADQIEVLLREESNQILDYDQNSSESQSDNQSDNEISSSDEERNGQGLQNQEDEEEMEFNSANMIEYVQNQDQDQVYEPQIDVIADGDGSKTTYESCSSNNSDESPDFQQKVEYSYKEQESQQIREFQDHEELQQNQEMPEKIKSISFLAQEQPVLFKTLRLNELQQARIIQFEEFEPYNNSNRQDSQLTGGRFTSQASTSNRLSLSKTFNFQMAIGNYCESQSSADSQNLPESTRDNIMVSEREKLHNELTMKVDEKIRMIAEEYSKLSQTQGFAELKKFQAFNQEMKIDTLENENPPEILKQTQKRNQSHESSQKPQTRFNLNNNLINDQENSDLNGTLNHQRSSLIQKQRLQERMSSTLNRGGLNFTNHVKDLTFSKNTGSFVTFNNTKPFKNMLSNSKEQNNSETKLMGSNYDKQLSESSSNKHKNAQHFNGISTQNFNRTMAFGLGGSNTNSKKLEEQVSELKYMLENVQCEAKNLKLLLNLKDDQIQMYESKNQDLICENEELNYKCEESKLKIDQIEEETLYFKALINNHNQGQNLGQKSTIATNIEKCLKKTQSTQANFPQMIMKTSNINSVGLSPIKEEIDHQLRSKDLSVRLEQSEKENINLMNMIQDYLEKVSKLERENDSLKSNLNIQIKEKSETKKQYASENKSLYWQLENTKRELTEREQRLGEAVQALDEIKIKDKKKSSKIKSLKKERDALRIEILKLKQIYSEKCDGYKENRIKLQRKLKKREEHLSKLENQLSQYEKFYRNQLQSSNVQTSSNIQRHENLQQQMLTNQRNGDQGQLNIRSSVSSRSLENTRNLSSTAKGVLRGLNQIGIRQDNSKETSQNVREILQNAYQPIISLSNSPKQKNLTPGSLPSGMGINGGKIDQYQKEKVMMKLKSHYKRLEVEEEKIVSNQNNRAGSQFSNNPPTKNYGKNQAITQVKNNHFISNDKSKSFYSSDIENNTLFDQNHIVMEDQSNSSNFFSNINNSNSHLFLDDSAITKALDISQNNIQKQYGDHSKMIQKIDSLSQIRATSDAYQNQVGQYQPVFRVQNPGSYQPIYPIAKSQSTSNNKQQQQRNIVSQMQSIQPDEAVQNKFGTIVQSQIKQNQQHQYPATTKSPISQISAEGKRNDATITYAALNKSTNQNLSQSDLNPNTQNSIRYHRNDSATSSNRNLHQIKDSQQRPPSTSSTNNTSNLFHNQVAMISYQSSSSGGSKHYQNKLSKLQGLNQMPITPAFQPYNPQKNSQPTNNYHSQVSGYPVNYSQQHQTKVGQNAQYQPHQNFNYPKDFSSYNQNSHQIPQYQVPNQQHYSLMNTTQTSIEDKYQSQAQGSSNNVNQTHKRQRSRQLDGLITNQDQQHIIQQQQNIQSNNFGSKNQQHINHQQNQYHERFDNYSSANQYPNHNYQQYLTSDKNQVDQRTSKADYAQQQKYQQQQNIEQIQKQKSQYQK